MNRQDYDMHVQMLILSQGVAGNQVNESQIWAIIGLVVMAMIYVTVVRPMMRRKDPLEKPSGFGSLSQQRTVERQMQNLLVELSEMARQITGQLDTRATKLEILLKQADAKIEALKTATAGAEGSPAAREATESLQRLFNSPPSAPDRGNTESTQAPDPRHSDIYALQDQGRDAYEIAAQLGRPLGEVELIIAIRSK